MARADLYPIRPGTTWDEVDLKMAKISLEVAWYCQSRGIDVPTTPPRVRTPEPGEAEGAVFDPERVDRVLAAFDQLRHTKGRFANKPLKPDPWQVAYIIAPVFGWVRWDDDADKYVRVVRTLYVDVPRKNGKTTIAGGLGLYLTAADGEYGAQVLACATTRDQARFAFDPIQTLAKSSEGMRRHLVATKYRVTHPLSGSYFQPVASVGDAQHGADLHGAIVDEVHLHKNNDLIESIETGTGSRTQPLLIFITTADAGRPNTPYANKRGRVDKLASRSLKDPTTYGVVWAADPDDDPMDPRTWAAANPGLGITPTWAFMEQAAAKAEDSPAELASFLRLHLGIRTRQTTRFIRLEDWDRNASIVTESDLVGREAYGGLDLAAVSDITALCWLFPDGRGGYDALWRLWAPADKVEELDSRTAGAASAWVRSGVLTLTPGNITDYDFVEEQIKRDLEKFDVRELAFDPWNSSHLVTNLGNEGAPMVQVRQGFVSMSPPLKELQRLVLTGTAEDPKLRHGGNPAVRWMMDNLAVATDPAGNVKPDKASSAEKIDAISALVNALSRGMVATSAATSAYDDDQGLMIV